MTDTVATLVERWEDAQKRHDADAVAAFYAETAEIDSPIAGHVTGREGVIKSAEAFYSAFPDMVATFEAPIICADRVALVGSFSGRQVGTFMGLAPTGKAIRFTVVFLLDIHDGEIVRDRRVYDFTGVLVQVGVLKAKPA
jgi:steroid delta-isomerase-like uncharacterized protein